MFFPSRQPGAVFCDLAESLNGSAAYAHDRNGNLTDDEQFTFYYDFANHLVRAVKQSTGDTVGEYHYDALGRRVRKTGTGSEAVARCLSPFSARRTNEPIEKAKATLPSGTTLFFYDGMRVIEDGMLDGNGTYTAHRQYLWGFYLDELLVFDYDAQGDFDLEDVSDQRHYCFQDFTYSTVAVMDPDGNIDERYDYQPYGAPNFWTGDYADTRAETAVHLDFLFTGQRHDPESGLHHYKFRALHPPLGRFLQRDPIGYRQSVALYECVRSAANRLVDPTGASSEGASGEGWSKEKCRGQYKAEYQKYLAYLAARDFAKERYFDRNNYMRQPESMGGIPDAWKAEYRQAAAAEHAARPLGKFAFWMYHEGCRCCRLRQVLKAKDMLPEMVDAIDDLHQFMSLVDLAKGGVGALATSNWSDDVWKLGGSLVEWAIGTQIKTGSGETQAIQDVVGMYLNAREQEALLLDVQWPLGGEGRERYNRGEVVWRFSWAKPKRPDWAQEWERFDWRLPYDIEARQDFEFVMCRQPSSDVKR